MHGVEESRLIRERTNQLRLKRNKLIERLKEKARQRSAYFKQHREHPETMTDSRMINPVVSTILWAVRNGRVFVFTADRNPKGTKAWVGARTLGATGKVEPGETGFPAAERELNEELMVGTGFKAALRKLEQELHFKSLTRKGGNHIQTIQPILSVDFAKKQGKPYLKSFYYLCRTDYSVLRTLVKRMQEHPEEFAEHMNPKIVPLERIRSKKMQPHYEMIVKQIRRALAKTPSAQK